jgi:hypothetical protein
MSVLYGFTQRGGEGSTRATTFPSNPVVAGGWDLGLALDRSEERVSEEVERDDMDSYDISPN